MPLEELELDEELLDEDEELDEELEDEEELDELELELELELDELLELPGPPPQPTSARVTAAVNTFITSCLRVMGRYLFKRSEFLLGNRNTFAPGLMRVTR